jgi:signal transduction histidine kinase/ligand-binding sensor domain-containing protein/DNA-binding response OmpR family regulator
MFNRLKCIVNFLYCKPCSIAVMLLCLFCAAKSFAQEDFRLTQLSVNEGLSHSDVTAIVQDQSGYLWLGTNNGLNRYDGSKVKVFKGRPNEPGTLPDSKITKLHADRGYRIWIGTQTSGLCYYDKRTQLFHPVDLKSALSYSNKITQSPFRISVILEDKKGNIWIAVRQLGLFVIRMGREGKIAEIRNFPLSDLPKEAKYSIQAMLITSEDTALFGASDGLHSFNRRTGKTEKLPDKNNNQTVNTIFKDTKGIVWVGRFDGLYVLNTKENTLSKVHLSAEVKNIKTIAQDSMGYIWLGCFGYGAYKVDSPNLNPLGTKVLRVYPLSKRALQTDFIGSIERINCFLQDKYGLLWIGTSAGGAGYLNISQRDIKRIQNTPLADHVLSDNYITAVFAEKDKIWVGTRKGLSVCAPAGKTESMLSGLHITAIHQDADGVFWITTREHGLKIIRYPSGQLEPKIENGTIKGLPNDLVFITEDHLKQIWIASSNKGVFIIKPGKSEALTFEKYSNGMSLSSGKINSLYKDPLYPWIWISTKDAGLDKIEQTGDRISLLKNYRYKANGGGLSSDHIWPVKRSNDSTIWIGTLGGGMNRLTKGKNGRERIKYITAANGLIDNDIEAIELDEKGNLWLAGYGLSKYDPLTGKVSFFDHNDGLQSNAFKVGASFKDSAGQLYFGGINGLNYFNPEGLGDHRIPPDILFTDLRIFNVSVSINEQKHGRIMLKNALNFTDKLVFNASQNDFTIEFSGIQLAQHSKLIYHYKLEDYNKDWVQTDISSASFSNLDPGTYQFLVYSSYNNVKSAVHRIEIQVLPPWWFTWWAFAIYLFLIVMAFYVYRKIITKENSLKNELVIADKEKELNRAKLEFFTNISHELRTPLSLIYGPITELLQQVDEDSRGKLWLMYRNTKRLMTLTNQLLDFRKMESGKLRLNVAEGNIVNFIREIWLIFKDKARDTSISYHISTEKEKVNLYFDREKMELVFSNLLSNAFKYTSKGGSIKVNIYVKGSAELDAIYENECLTDNYLEVIVEDNGVGIPPQEIEKIFDIYYQVANSRSLKSTGTGLGLSIAKGIMDLQKGFIKVESSLQQGSRFIVGIPFGKMHFEKDDLIVDYKGPDHLIHYDEVSVKDVEQYTLQKAYPYSPELLREEPMDSSEEDEQRESSKWKVLLVEDNPELLDYLKENFKRSFKVITARDGLDGWEKVKLNLPDLVISDVMMPDMNGLELCRMIKRSPEYNFIPVLLLTARTASVYEIEGIETGADDYITKPFDIRLLNAKVNNFLQCRVKIKEYYRNIISLKDVKPESTNADEIFVNRMITIVENNLENKDFGVLMLAQELAMSKSSLFKRVKDITGNSPVDFIRSVRIRKAAKLLMSGHLNVNEIALQVGISDLKYFREQFRKYYKTTPTEYARQSVHHDGIE